MRVPGHLGVGLLAAAWFGPRLPWGLVLLGALLPDAVDKGAHLLGWTAGSRGLAHSPLLWLPLAWWMLRRGPWAGAVAVGALSHLAADLVEGVVLTVVQGGEGVFPWLFWPAPARALPSLVLPGLGLPPGPGRLALDVAAAVAGLAVTARRLSTRSDAPTAP